MESKFKVLVIGLCALFVYGDPMYTPGKFLYSKCCELACGPVCRPIDITKVRQELPSLWPPGPYAILMSNDTCPEPMSHGWKQGTFEIKAPDGKALILHFCVKAHRSQESAEDKGKWPSGTYYIYRSGLSCPEGFAEFNRTVEYETFSHFGQISNYSVVEDLGKTSIAFLQCGRNVANISMNESGFGEAYTEFLTKKFTYLGSCIDKNGEATDTEACLDVLDSDNFELSSQFLMTTGILPALNLGNERIVWYQFDFRRTLSLSKVEIAPETISNTLFQEMYKGCFYDNVKRTVFHLDEAVFNENITVNEHSLVMRNVRGRYITLVFNETSGTRTLQSKKAVRFFLSDLPDNNPCNEDLGMEDGSIQDFQITASSWLLQYVASAARPSDVGWCPETTDSTPWILVDLIAITRIDGLSVWISGRNQDTVLDNATSCQLFDLFYGIDSNIHVMYNDTEFHAREQRATDVQTYIFPNSFDARFVKLEFRNCDKSSSNICLKFELHGCKLAGVPSFNCQNEFDIFDIDKGLRTDGNPVTYKNENLNESCSNLCLQNANCSLVTQNKDGYCTEYPPSKNGMWQVAETLTVKSSAKLCGKDYVELFPTIELSMKTCCAEGKMTNVQYIERDSIITSIGYPFSTGSGRQYSWLLQFPANRYVRIIFTNVSLGFQDSGCYDRILANTVMNENIGGKPINHSYNERIFVIETARFNLSLTFSTCLVQKNVTNRGFRAVVKGEKIPACMSESEIVSYGRSSNCMYPDTIISSMSLLNYPYLNEEEVWNLYHFYIKQTIQQLQFMDFYVTCPLFPGDLRSKFEITFVAFHSLRKRTVCNTDMPFDVINAQDLGFSITYRRHNDHRTVSVRPEGFRLRFLIIEIGQSLKSLTSFEQRDQSSQNYFKVCSKTFGKCYHVYTKSSRTSNEATELCRKCNQMLVSVQSEYEMQYVNFLLREGPDRFVVKDEIRFSAHIGARRVHNMLGKKTYVWQNSEPVIYFPWKPGNLGFGKDCVRTSFPLIVERTWVADDCKTDVSPFSVCQSPIEDDGGNEDHSCANNTDTCKDVIWQNWRLPSKISLTFSGATCQNWDSLSTKAEYDFEARFPDLTKPSGNNNFCIDHDSSGMLWCYTSNSAQQLWEPCFWQLSGHKGNSDSSESTESDKFECDDSRKINMSSLCDGVFDCVDFTDETLCRMNKQQLNKEIMSHTERDTERLERGSYFLCGSKEWISIIAKCDDVIDCSDASDEIDCSSLNNEFHQNVFSCHDGDCQECDFLPEYTTAENELKVITCEPGEYMCDNTTKQCISVNKRCDAMFDCIDGSDEHQCSSCKDSFHCDSVFCIPRHLKCDKNPDCDDGTDENNCVYASESLSSCYQIWDHGNHTSGHYMIDDINVYCDFSSITKTGKISMSIHNIDVEPNSGLIYTKSSSETFIPIMVPTVTDLIYRNGYSCNLEVKTTCQFQSTSSMIDDSSDDDVIRGCRCKVEAFKIKQLDQGSTSLESASKYTFMKHKTYNCNGTELSGDQTNEGYYNVTSDGIFIVDDRILSRELPVYVTPKQIICTYEYKGEMLPCIEERKTIPPSMLCVYDVDRFGVPLGCRYGSNLENCGSYLCPPNYVKCPGSYCIPQRFVCDGTVQCPVGEDEYDCTCSKAAREVLIFVEDDSSNDESKHAASNLAKQLYTAGSDIRMIYFRSENPLEDNFIENRLLELREEQIFPVLKPTSECQFKSMARNLFGQITFKTNQTKVILFIENSLESSKVAELMFRNLSKPEFMIYRVSKKENFTIRQNMPNTYKFVKDIQVNRWDAMLHVGYRRFPEICIAATEVECSGGYRCSSSPQCIPPDQVCDGIANCHMKDDEQLCQFFCPYNCTCIDYTVSCRAANLSFKRTKTLYRNTLIADVSKNPGLKNVLRKSNFRFVSMTKLNLSSCDISTLNKEGFLYLRNLKCLDVGYNRIKMLPDRLFGYLEQLVFLNMDGNFQLEIISSTAFHGLKNLRRLHITGTKLKRVSSFTFSYLRLESINISYNEITEIEDYAFNGTSVKIIDFRGNNIVSFNKRVFDGVSLLQELQTPAFKFCCIRPCSVAESDCFPQKNEFSSCGDLMRHPVLQAVLWIVGIIAIFGNLGSILYRIVYDRERLKIGYGIFVTNLAGADFLMGVYLLMIAVADAMFRNRYIYVDTWWRNSNWCTTAGILSTVSSEASVLFVCFITLDRLLVIKYPFGSKRFNPRKAYICCILSWAIAILVAVIPVVFTGYFENRFYSRSAVCIALPLTRDRPPGWIYSVSIFVGMNVCTFILVAVGQLSIYLELRKATDGTQKTLKSRKQDLQVARNLIFVATTDFMCWFPIGLMGVLALNGYPIPGDVYAWTAVFILPFNSALNPILYTVTAILGKKSFNPNVEEQNRTEIQQETASAIIQYKDIIRSVRIKSDIAQVGERVKDLLRKKRSVSMVDVIAIGIQLSKYLSFLHDSSVAIEQLSTSTAYVKVNKRHGVSIVLDSDICISNDENILQENIYQFGIILEGLTLKCRSTKVDGALSHVLSLTDSDQQH